MVKELHYKGMSRCYVYKEEHIDMVLNLIKEIDEYEFEYYMPDNWVCFWDGDVKNKPNMDYSGKFDLDLDELYVRCKSNGIEVTIESESYDNDFDEDDY